MKGEWLIPVTIALVAGGLAYLYAPTEPPQLRTIPEPDTRLDGPYVLVPANGSIGASTLLRYDADPRHGIGDFLDLHSGQSNGSHWRWDGGDATCLRGGDCTSQGRTSIPLDNATQAGNATIGPGNDTVEATFFLFNRHGYLLATNAHRLQWEAFDLHREFVPLSDRLWHIGPGDGSDGARKVPIYRSEVEGLLDGAAVGQVRSGVLVEHAYDRYIGPVWLTVRVDAVHPT